MDSPFENIQNDDPADSMFFRVQLLGDTKRGFAKVRKAFVQRSDEAGNRASVLSALVKGKKERAFDALMLLLALEPVLGGTPLPLRTWAKMIGSEARPCSSQSASLAFDTLVDHKLVARTNEGRTVIVAPRLEDGSGAEWDNPGSNPATIGKGYLTIPHAYWTTGLVDRLSFPGKALFLIMLSETTKDRSFAMAAERAPSWYGVSERTAERGYKELRDQETTEGVPLLFEHPQYKRDARSPTGYRTVVHRALSGPYSQAARAELQLTTRNAVRRIAAKQKAAEAETNQAAESV